MPQDGGEGINELLWRSTSGLLTEGATLVREGLQAGPAGGNPQLGRLPVRSLMFAHGLSSEVKALREGGQDGLLR